VPNSFCPNVWQSASSWAPIPAVGRGLLLGSATSQVRQLLVISCPRQLRRIIDASLLPLGIALALSLDESERCMSRDHELFKQYPLRGTARISTGEVPTPYHIYDGHGVLIGGTVDLGAARRLLRDEKVAPVEAGHGRTFMGIWVCNFTDASLAPHHELQFSFFIDGPKARPGSLHLLSLIGLMTRPGAQMLCHGLWNNTPAAVAYNHELLNLNSRRAHSHIENQPASFKFDFQDATTGKPILAGSLANLQRVSLRASWDLVAQLSVKQTWELARRSWMNLQILNPTGVVLAKNAVAESFTKNDKNLVRYFNPHTDSLQFGKTPYAALNFQPQFIQYMEGFKFVYLQPAPMGERRRAS
jgi:hypothetical protein